MSVRELEMLVNNYLNPASKPQKTYSKASSKLSGELRSFLVDLQRTFATKVKISGDENKGRIVIDYFTNDDLQRIYEILKSIKI
jgi:ParB family chromosome partitioning protein